MHKASLALLALSALALAPATSFAREPHCEHTAPRGLALDLQGIKTVVVEVESHDIKLQSQTGGNGQLQGRACASDAKLLPQLTVSQQRQGDKLVVRLHRESTPSLFVGNRYAYLQLSGNLPDHLPVQLKVGSGDAEISGAPIVSADVGSGDAIVRRTRGLVAGKVGSGDLEVDDAGSLQIIAVNSGDAKARGIRGPVKVGSIGSGDFELDGAQGKVEIESVGSGDAEVASITGDVSVGSLGSGNVTVRDVRGNLVVRDIGSGSVDHSGVTGQVTLPRNH